MRRFLVIMITVMMSVGVISGCFWDDKDTTESAQSMEQIYRQEGVPVKTITVQAQQSSKSLKYSATLSGQSEAIGFSKMADVVQEVRCNIGDYVKKDQIVVTFPQDNQSVQYFQAKAAFDLATTTKERMAKLFEKGLISRQELDNVNANYEVTKANLNAVSSVIWIKAPLSGYITQINVKPSDTVAVGTPLFTVSNLNKIEAKLWVSSNEIDYIEPGQKAVVEWNGSQIEGRITQVSKVMNLGYKAFEVRALFNNAKNLLTSGVTADITIESNIRNNVIEIDRKCISVSGDQNYVFVVEDGRAVHRDITLGRSEDLTVEIVDGLQDGDILIAERNAALEDGIKVKLISE